LWKPVAFKLPEPDILALRRYADVHRVSISDVLREGMALRLGQNGAPYELYRHTPPAEPAEDLRQAAATTALQEIRDSLARLESQVQALTQAVTSQQTPHGYTVISEGRPATVEPLALGAASKGRVKGRRTGYGAKKDRVLATALAQQPSTCDAIATVLGWLPKDVWQALQALVKEGVLVQSGTGQGRLYAQPGRLGGPETQAV
jgi:biotin operon repressor